MPRPDWQSSVNYAAQTAPVNAAPAHQLAQGTDKTFRDIARVINASASATQISYTVPAGKRLTITGIYVAAQTKGLTYIREGVAVSVKWVGRLAAYGNADAEFQKPEQFAAGEKFELVTANEDTGTGSYDANAYGYEENV